MFFFSLCLICNEIDVQVSLDVPVHWEIMKRHSHMIDPSFFLFFVFAGLEANRVTDGAFTLSKVGG